MYGVLFGVRMCIIVEIGGWNGCLGIMGELCVYGNSIMLRRQNHSPSSRSRSIILISANLTINFGTLSAYFAEISSYITPCSSATSLPLSSATTLFPLKSTLFPSSIILHLSGTCFLATSNHPPTPTALINDAFFVTSKTITTKSLFFRLIGDSFAKYFLGTSKILIWIYSP